MLICPDYVYIYICICILYTDDFMRLYGISWNTMEICSTHYVSDHPIYGNLVTGEWNHSDARVIYAIQLIGLREKIQETPIFHGKIMENLWFPDVSCRFSFKSTHWAMVQPGGLTGVTMVTISPRQVDWSLSRCSVVRSSIPSPWYETHSLHGPKSVYPKSSSRPW